MLFGYTAAVIAGFLLTAARNWSGIDTITGTPLAMIATLWLLARILPFISTIPTWLIALTDLAFFPLISVALAKPLWQDKNRANRVFIMLFLAITIANLMVHAEILGMMSLASNGIQLMTDLVILLVLIISGRVLPFFTQAVIPGYMASRWLWVEQLTIVLMIVVIILNQVYSGTSAQALTYSLLAVLQIIHVTGWHHPRIWSIPVLWVLYTGYVWLIIGLVLSGLSAADLFQSNLAKHALTVGVIGIFTLGMMSRVTLGHTGRPMQTTRSVNLAFLLMNIASASRVFLPAIFPASYQTWIYLSGGLWISAFIIFCITHAPHLVQARVDGAPG